MTQITFTIIVLVFVELVNGQDACTTAQRNLAMNIACTSAFAARSDIEAICMTCRDLFNAIISNCDGTVSQTILLAIYLTFKVSYMHSLVNQTLISAQGLISFTV